MGTCWERRHARTPTHATTAHATTHTVRSPTPGHLVTHTHAYEELVGHDEMDQSDGRFDATKSMEI